MAVCTVYWIIMSVKRYAGHMHEHYYDEFSRSGYIISSNLLQANRGNGDSSLNERHSLILTPPGITYPPRFVSVTKARLWNGATGYNLKASFTTPFRYVRDARCSSRTSPEPPVASRTSCRTRAAASGCLPRRYRDQMVVWVVWDRETGWALRPVLAGRRVSLCCFGPFY